MEGLLIVDKPTGMTSHDVVARIRSRFNVKRVGHAGTLDPLATGVLVLLVGKATKLSNKFMGFDKAYQATLKLGTTTATADIDGKVLKSLPFECIVEEDIYNTFESFFGEIDQLPPMYSAVKFKGQRLYKLARQGIEVEREPRRVKIKKLEIEKISLPEIRFYLECSKGTYVRQLAQDIGEQLRCGACITQIRRLAVGPFNIEQAIHLDEINESHLQPWPG